MLSTDISYRHRRNAEPAFQSRTDARSNRDGMTRLLQQIARGDRDAFAAFYQQTSRRVHGVTQRVIADAAQSADITEEIFLAVWRDAPKYNPAMGSPMVWLMTMSHRKVVDKVRAQRSSAAVAEASGAPDHNHVSETVMQRSSAAATITCPHTLSALQREALELAYYGGLTSRELAAILFTAPPNIERRIRDGLNLLRDCVGTT